MLHLLPSTLKKEKPESSDGGGPGSSTYKRQKDAKNKALSSRYPWSHWLFAPLFVIWFSFKLTCFFLPVSSHNWNTLFLGTSAVADAIAEKYNTTKSQVLDHVSDATSHSLTFPSSSMLLIKRDTNEALFWSLSSSAGVQRKYCCEDGTGRNTNCARDSTVPIGQRCLSGFLQSGGFPIYSKVLLAIWFTVLRWLM